MLGSQTPDISRSNEELGPGEGHATSQRQNWNLTPGRQQPSQGCDPCSAEAAGPPCSPVASCSLLFNSLPTPSPETVRACGELHEARL